MFQKRLVRSVPGLEQRIRMKVGPVKPAQSAATLLRELVIRDIAALEEVLASTDGSTLSSATELLHDAGIIFLLGQSCAAPVIELLRYAFTLLGKRCVPMDSDSGLATYTARVIGPRDAMLVVAFRSCTESVTDAAQEASEKGVPVIVITDSSLSRLARSATILFSVPERDYLDSRSLAATLCLAQSMVVSVAARSQKDILP